MEFSSETTNRIAGVLSKVDSCLDLKLFISYTPDSSESVHENTISFNDIIDKHYENTRTGELASDDVIFYFRTSGSTGPPKAVGRTHFHLLNSTDLSNERFGLDENSVWFCDRSFSWGLGTIRTMAACGCTRVFVDTKLSLTEGHIDTLCEIIDAESCTHVFMPSYLVTDLLDRPDLASKFSKVANVNCSGERIPRRYSSLLGAFCRELCYWYGSQEAAGVACFSSSNPESYEDGIIGKPFTGISMKIVDQKGNIVPYGQTGELHLLAPYTFKEYRGMPKKYKAAFDTDGWFRTGDIGHVRTDGNIVLDGRESERIAMGTLKCFPQPVENIIAGCSSVTNVVVVPVQDRRLQNVFCACVIISGDTCLDSVKKFCDNAWSSEISGSVLSTKPRYYLLYQNFPVTSTGKLDRKSLAKDATEKLGL